MYYVYQLSSPDGEIFYIGKGKDNRMYTHISCAKGHSIRRSQNPHLYNKILKIINSGQNIKYDKLFISENENECFEKEIFYIKEIGTVEDVEGVKRGTLLNLTLGGEGTSGYKLSEETKNRMSLSKKGKPRVNFIPWNKGKMNVYSEESLQKMRDVKTGKHHTEETKNKQSNSHKGKNKGPISEKHRIAIIEGIKNKKISKENSSH